MGPSNIPMPVGNLSGWTQIFTDDFTSTCALGNFPQSGLPGSSSYAGRWISNPDGWTDTSGNGTYETSKVVSAGSDILDLYIHYASGMYCIACPIPILVPGSGHDYGQGQLYGRFSVCMRTDALHGYKTAFLLWPNSENWPTDGEIDFPEANLDDTNVGAYMHHQGATSGGDQDVFSAASDRTQWHVYTTEWTPSTVKFYQDSTLIGTSTSRIPNTPMRWNIQQETTLDGYLPATGTAGHLQIDWVAAWSYTPGSGAGNVSGSGTGKAGAHGSVTATVTSPGGVSGSPYNGVVVGGVTWIAGKFNQEAHFDGSTEYIDLSGNVPPSMNAASGTPWTQDLWLTTGTTSTSLWQDPLACVDSSGNAGWGFYFNSGYFVAYVNGTELASVAGCTDGSPHHVRLCHDGTRAYFFVDGALQNAGGTAITWTKLTSPGCAIGCQIPGVGATPIGFFPGSVDEVATFDTCLTTTNFTPPTAPFPNNVPYGVALLHMDGNANDSYNAVASGSGTGTAGARGSVALRLVSKTFTGSAGATGRVTATITSPGGVSGWGTGTAGAVGHVSTTLHSFGPARPVMGWPILTYPDSYLMVSGNVSGSGIGEAGASGTSLAQISATLTGQAAAQANAAPRITNTVAGSAGSTSSIAPYLASTSLVAAAGARGSVSATVIVVARGAAGSWTNTTFLLTCTKTAFGGARGVVSPIYTGSSLGYASLPLLLNSYVSGNNLLVYNATAFGGAKGVVSPAQISVTLTSGAGAQASVVRGITGTVAGSAGSTSSASFSLLPTSLVAAAGARGSVSATTTVANWNRYASLPLLLNSFTYTEAGFGAGFGGGSGIVSPNVAIRGIADAAASGIALPTVSADAVGTSGGAGSCPATAIYMTSLGSAGAGSTLQNTVAVSPAGDASANGIALPTVSVGALGTAGATGRVLATVRAGATGSAGTVSSAQSTLTCAVVAQAAAQGSTATAIHVTSLGSAGAGGAIYPVITSAYAGVAGAFGGIAETTVCIATEGCAGAVGSTTWLLSASAPGNAGAGGTVASAFIRQGIVGVAGASASVVESIVVETAGHAGATASCIVGIQTITSAEAGSAGGALVTVSSSGLGSAGAVGSTTRQIIGSSAASGTTAPVITATLSGCGSGTGLVAPTIISFAVTGMAAADGFSPVFPAITGALQGAPHLSGVLSASPSLGGTLSASPSLSGTLETLTKEAL